ncbi:Dabb family protein [Salinibacterium sp. NSLL150]|uniref:Dabb family protein n=1 Tax=unclassified Salinibacterium TaxID=2632331 RepID=UPI0018CD5B95|nr:MULTISPECIES: Dabb family protein [unclassified Salinibacterium]MBH0055045.1 Dabb family protein [Salinibacterium sp. SWN139]MBH0083813.1 Dabb family protein [Salinibacterium sp. SWN167]MBH0099955.1 Dabb family protein [Salinibacterium sp. NSLL35]MBH0102709.1 Dabb family protein [Salinibacterium sp. NSLL150]MBH0105469.1 Dabb family protein [Salinibacterium sp. NSLL16]
MIRHVVMWKLIAEDPADQKIAADAMAAALEPLVGKIDGLEALTVRPDVATVAGNWDVILVSDHTSVEALAAYGTHPLHVEAGAVVKANTRERACVDFEL